LLLSRNIVAFSTFYVVPALRRVGFYCCYDDRCICERSQYVFTCFSPSNLCKFSLARTTLAAVKYYFIQRPADSTPVADLLSAALKFV